VDIGNSSGEYQACLSPVRRFKNANFGKKTLFLKIFKCFSLKKLVITQSPPIGEQLLKSRLMFTNREFVNRGCIGNS